LFSVNGGLDGIKQMVNQHYDLTITPPNSDLSNIIKNIKLSLHNSNLDDFLDWLYIESQKRGHLAGPCFEKHNQYIKLWDELYACSEEIRLSIVNYVKEKHFEEIVFFVDRYNSSIDEILCDTVIARKLWNSDKVCSGFPNEGAWRILERLIHNKMIPDTEKNIFNIRLYTSVPKYYPEDKVGLLKETDYFEKYKKSYIDSSQYIYENGGIGKANLCAPFFFRFIRSFGLDSESVKTINQIMSFATFGEFYDKTISFMKEKQNLLSYREICKENGLKDLSDAFSIDKDN
jgi:hypothetical protein